jgi:predicted O-methyltransferase YrrM
MLNGFYRWTIQFFKKFRALTQKNHRSPLIPIQNIENLFPNFWNENILLGKMEWTFGSLANESLIFLCFLVKNLRARSVFEFGTFTGRTTYNIALNLPDDGIIYTIDSGINTERSNISRETYPPYIVGECFRSADEKIRKKIILYIHDSKRFDFSHLKGKMDLVFIDGGHDYETVRSDSENAFKIIKKGGVIVWDDYSPFWPGVEKFLNELGKKIPLYLYKDLAIFKHDS